MMVAYTNLQTVLIVSGIIGCLAAMVWIDSLYGGDDESE